MAVHAARGYEKTIFPIFASGPRGSRRLPLDLADGRPQSWPRGFFYFSRRQGEMLRCGGVLNWAENS